MLDLWTLGFGFAFLSVFFIGLGAALLKIDGGRKKKTNKYRSTYP